MAKADLSALLMREAEGLSIEDTIRLLSRQFPEGITFSTSFSYEDQILTHLILEHQLPVRIFTLDTGRLFPETYAVWEATKQQYDFKPDVYFPDPEQLASHLLENGPNAFYTSVEKRQACCFIRKVAPLKRALQGKKVWITGLRAGHSTNRRDFQKIEWDATNSILKYNPLLDWSMEDLIRYIKKHQVPYNSLHDKGFPSIGCQPCTRAIREGEDFRAGRWWWEDHTKKECGLHRSG